MMSHGSVFNITSYRCIIILQTHYLSTQCYILPSYEVDPTGDVPILITNVNTFNGILEEQVSCT